LQGSMPAPHHPQTAALELGSGRLGCFDEVGHRSVLSPSRFQKGLVDLIINSHAT
jgi:hypothetical protein